MGMGFAGLCSVLTDLVVLPALLLLLAVFSAAVCTPSTHAVDS